MPFYVVLDLFYFLSKCITFVTVCLQLKNYEWLWSSIIKKHQYSAVGQWLGKCSFLLWWLRTNRETEHPSSFWLVVDFGALSTYSLNATWCRERCYLIVISLSLSCLKIPCSSGAIYMFFLDAFWYYQIGVDLFRISYFTYVKLWTVFVLFFL